MHITSFRVQYNKNGFANKYRFGLNNLKRSACYLECLSLDKTRS